jgi:hypothetical protein
MMNRGINVTATIIQKHIEQNHNTETLRNRKKHYKVRYSYKVNGMMYTIKDFITVSTKGVFYGRCLQVKVIPDEPERSYLEEAIDSKTILECLVPGILLTILGLVVVLTVILRLCLGYNEDTI